MFIDHFSKNVFTYENVNFTNTFTVRYSRFKSSRILNYKIYFHFFLRRPKKIILLIQIVEIDI